MSVTQDQVVDYIKNLKLGQVKELISILEDELGVSASAPVMAMGAAPAAGGGEAAEGALRLESNTGGLSETVAGVATVVGTLARPLL